MNLIDYYRKEYKLFIITESYLIYIRNKNFFIPYVIDEIKKVKQKLYISKRF